MIVVDQVVLDARVLHTIHIDAAAAAEGVVRAIRNRVVVDAISSDERTGDDAVSALAQIAVHVDSATVVIENRVIPNHWPIAAVGNVDSVLFDRARR